MRRIKNIGLVVQLLLILISFFLIFSSPSYNAFYLLISSSVLFLFFYKAIKVSSSMKMSSSYEDQINLLDSNVIGINKPKSFSNTVYSRSFQPIRFWSIVIGVCHFTYGAREFVDFVEGNLPTLNFNSGLFFLMKLLLLGSGVVTLFYIVIMRFFSVVE